VAWIESHQSVWQHAKTRKAARILGVHEVQVVGHLHALWHWAIDHAEDGNVSKYDTDDLALAARWDGDADTFVAALTSCGPGASSGFLEAGGSYGNPDHGLVGELVIHDWWKYAGKLVERRGRDRVRARARRSDVPQPPQNPADVVGASHDGLTTVPQPSSGRPLEVVGTSHDGLVDVGSPARATNQPTVLPTNPQPFVDCVDTDEPNTEDQVDPELTEDDERHPLYGFAAFWDRWPRRNGKRLDRGKAERIWGKLTLEQRRAAYVGAGHYAAACELGSQGAMDAFRWLRDHKWADWQEPATPTARGRPAVSARDDEVEAHRNDREYWLAKA
jgi:hypothetical protein